MQTVWDMWKTCFGDCNAYMKLYFREKYRPENTLLYIDNGKAVASLQMLPFGFTFHEAKIPVAYFSGLCTLPQAQKKGFMSALIKEAFIELAKRDIALALLVPQEEWLLKFYDKFGFAQTFDAGKEALFSLKELLEKHVQKIDEAYSDFDSRFRNKEMTVQKTFDDFRTIVEEAKIFNFPPKKNLMAMARVINAEQLLEFFAIRHSEKVFSVSIKDTILMQNNDGFIVQMGRVIKHPSHSTNFIEVDIRMLAQLLLGYQTSQKKEPLRWLFPEKVPCINFMLE